MRLQVNSNKEVIGFYPEDIQYQNLPADLIVIDDTVYNFLQNKMCRIKNNKTSNLTVEDFEEYTIQLTDEEQLQNLRNQRNIECFSVINQNYIVNGKSATWFDTLTAEQKTIANAWVQAWRDVTTTRTVPQKPSFI